MDDIHKTFNKVVDEIYKSDDEFRSQLMKVYLYGGTILPMYRCWWNPMRYIKGAYYMKYISPKKMYKNR